MKNIKQLVRMSHISGFILGMAFADIIIYAMRQELSWIGLAILTYGLVSLRINSVDAGRLSDSLDKE